MMHESPHESRRRFEREVTYVARRATAELSRYLLGGAQTPELVHELCTCLEVLPASACGGGEG